VQMFLPLVSSGPLSVHDLFAAKADAVSQRRSSLFCISKSKASKHASTRRAESRTTSSVTWLHRLV